MNGPSLSVSNSHRICCRSHLLSRKEFSDWIGRTKRKPVHVIKTDYRPVPLSHYLWANLKLHKVMEGKSGFLDKGYREAGIALKPKEAVNQKGTTAKVQKTPAPTSGRGAKHMAWQQQGSKQNWMSLVRFLEREELTPTVIFSFSKKVKLLTLHYVQICQSFSHKFVHLPLGKKCEEIADMLRSLDLNTAAERSAVQGFTLQTVARLSPIDAVLPQVVTVCEMVKRGIGVVSR
jgi:antiviral helicase SKI2